MAGKGQSNQQKKRCFVVSEFGSTEAERRERNQVLKHLVKRVLEPLGYEVRRADDIDDPGQITHQIIERLIEDELVVADLTNRNPNVFYELAVRHAARKPVITLMVEGEELPFDLKDVRTVFFDLHDPDKLETAQEELSLKAKAIEASNEPVRNPVTVAHEAALLQQSEDPDVQASGQLLASMSELRDEVRTLTRRASTEDRPSSRFVSPVLARKRLGQLFRPGDENLTLDEIADRIRAPRGFLLGLLEEMAERGEVLQTPDGWKSCPA